MAHYRFYLLDAKNKIVEGVDAECLSDDAAYLEATSRLVGDVSGEVWRGTQFIGRTTTQTSLR